MPITQKGNEINIGFGNYKLTGYVMREVEVEPTAEVKSIVDEDNDTKTILISNPGKKISLTAYIPKTTNIEPPSIGSTVTINSVAYRLESSRLRLGPEEAEISMTLVKENSMTYT